MIAHLTIEPKTPLVTRTLMQFSRVAEENEWNYEALCQNPPDACQLLRGLRALTHPSGLTLECAAECSHWRNSPLDPRLCASIHDLDGFCIRDDPDSRFTIAFQSKKVGRPGD